MTKDDDRRAAALRENLRRRKAQGRARAEREPEPEHPAAAVETSDDTAAGALPDRTAID